MKNNNFGITPDEMPSNISEEEREAIEAAQKHFESLETWTDDDLKLFQCVKAFLHKKQIETLLQMTELLSEEETSASANGEIVSYTTVFERFAEIAEREKKRIEGEGISDLIPDAMKKIDRIIASKARSESAIDDLLSSLTFSDSGNNYINNSPVLKSLEKREAGDIWLGTDPQTGNDLIFTIFDGFLSPFEADITECVAKFKFDGQLTKNGKIYCTLSQLYRAQRHGKGTTRPTKKQRDDLLQQLKTMSQEERKIGFEISDYVEIGKLFPELANIDAQTNGGRLRILSFDEFRSKIRGKKDWIIVFDDTPFINRLSEWLRTGEIIPQEVKAIQFTKYYLEFKKDGKTSTEWFTSNEKRRAFCKRNGIGAGDIVSYHEAVEPYPLSEQRIAIRHTILSFVFSYLRARCAGKPHSNKLPYSAIFERCDVDVKTRMQADRARESVKIILDHLVATIPELTRWEEYKNVGSKKADGVQISVEKAISGGEQ